MLHVGIVVGRGVACLGHGIDHILLPVVLDQGFQIFAISCFRMRDVVVREPSLQLSLVPFVVCCPSVSCAVLVVTMGDTNLLCFLGTKWML